MKKRLAITLVLMLVFSIFSGCAKEVENTTVAEATSNEVAETSANGDDLTFGMVAVMLSHEFYGRCIDGIQMKCDELGVELLVGDSNGDANEQLNIAQQFITQGVDAILLSPADPVANEAITKAANDAGIPVITESDVVSGAVTKVGLDTYEAGFEVGKWMGEELIRRDQTGKVLIVHYPILQNIVSLVDGYKDGLDASGCDYEVVSEVDGSAMKETSMQVTIDALTANPDVNVIYGINDDSILGAIQGAGSIGFDLSNVITGTNGLEGNPGCIAMMEDKTLTVAMAQLSECYGMVFAEAAYLTVQGEQLPDLYYAPSTVVTADNFSEYYNGGNGDYNLNMDAAWALREAMTQE